MMRVLGLVGFVAGVLEHQVLASWLLDLCAEGGEAFHRDGGRGVDLREWGGSGVTAGGRADRGDLQDAG